MEKDNRAVRVTTLDNGIRIIGEYIPYFPSVSVGIWVGTGSACETEETNGLSHFIEHMLFKSTDHRSVLDIASEIDFLGGNVNAYTSKECTCYYAKVIQEHLPRALSLLSDILLYPRFDAEEFERERGVILEEIAMSEDTPDDTVLDLLAEGWFGKHPLGMPILGYADRISSVSRETVLSFRQSHYRPEKTVIAVAGMFDFEAFAEQCNALFGGWKPDMEPVQEMPVFSGPDYKAIIREKDIEQIHIAQAWQGVGQKDLRLYPLSVACNLLGGGNASRLFQRIRESMGAAYSVYAYPSVYSKLGTVVIYAATNPENAQRLSHALHEEIQRLRDGIEDSEFRMAKEQLKVSYLLGMESGFSRMMTLGRSLLLYGEVTDPHEVLAHMNDVTFEQVREEIERIFGGKYAAAAVGRGVKDLML